MSVEKLQRMQESVRTGGKGSVRRKKKAQHKTTGTDDKRLQSTLKRLGVNNIPAIEEVNLFKDNGMVIHFNNPKVQASIAANTYVVSGHAETKKLQELLPGIINQLGPDNLANLKKLAETYQGGGAHRVLQTSGHCWALASAPNPSPRTSALEGPGLTRGLTILRARHPLTPAARAQM